MEVLGSKEQYLGPIEKGLIHKWDPDSTIGIYIF